MEHFPTDHEARVALAERFPKGGIGVEIGVQRGNHARLLFDVAKPRQLYLIDKWGPADRPGNESTRRGRHGKHKQHLLTCLGHFANEIQDRQVIFHRGWSGQCLGTYPDNFFDWAYIDADHTFDGALRDLRLCGNRTRPGGFLGGHDWSVIKRKDKKWIKVKEAVETFLAERPDWRLVFTATGPLNRKPAGFLLQRDPA